VAEDRYAGGCFCAAVRYELSGAVSNLCWCHCTSCRRAAGAPSVPWGTVPRERFRVTRGELTEYRSSPLVRRGFCASCGTSLTYHHESRAAEIDVALATLDEPERLAPRAHLWVADKLPWVTIGDGLPQFAAGSSGTPLTATPLAGTPRS
jgi:hypothetical protein